MVGPNPSGVAAQNVATRNSYRMTYGRLTVCTTINHAEYDPLMGGNNHSPKVGLSMFIIHIRIYIEGFPHQLPMVLSDPILIFLNLS